MPYPSEHAARMADPGEFDPKSFRRKQLAPGIAAVLGRRGEGGPMTVQAYRFAIEEFTPGQARVWLGQHKLEPVLFEEAEPAPAPKGDGEGDGGEGGDGSNLGGHEVEIEVELTEEAPSQEAEEDGEAGGGETGSTATEQESEQESEQEPGARGDEASKSRKTYHIANVLPAYGFRSLSAEEEEPGVLVLAGEPKAARGTRAVQGYRFLQSEMSAEDARSWLADRGVDVVLVEAERADADGGNGDGGGDGEVRTDQSYDVPADYFRTLHGQVIPFVGEPGEGAPLAGNVKLLAAVSKKAAPAAAAKAEVHSPKGKAKASFVEHQKKMALLAVKLGAQGPGAHLGEDGIKTLHDFTNAEKALKDALTPEEHDAFANKGAAAGKVAAVEQSAGELGATVAEAKSKEDLDKIEAQLSNVENQLGAAKTLDPDVESAAADAVVAKMKLDLAQSKAAFEKASKMTEAAKKGAATKAAKKAAAAAAGKQAIAAPNTTASKPAGNGSNIKPTNDQVIGAKMLSGMPFDDDNPTNGASVYSVVQKSKEKISKAQTAAGVSEKTRDKLADHTGAWAGEFKDGSYHDATYAAWREVTGQREEGKGGLISTAAKIAPALQEAREKAPERWGKALEIIGANPGGGPVETVYGYRGMKKAEAAANVIEAWKSDGPLLMPSYELASWTMSKPMADRFAIGTPGFTGGGGTYSGATFGKAWNVRDVPFGMLTDDGGMLSDFSHELELVAGTGNRKGVPIDPREATVWIKGKSYGYDQKDEAIAAFEKHHKGVKPHAHGDSEDLVSAHVNANHVQRFDYAPLMHSVKTPEGYLLSEGYAGRAGVLSYRQDDGSVRRELVPPEELFNVDSLASLARKPVTLGHPMRDGAAVMVSPGNVGEFGVGDVDGEIIEERLGGFVKVRVAVRRQDAIDSVERGDTRGLSQGYVCDLDETPGTWRGQKYDAVQRNRRYNHLALCALGRAGIDARLHVDSAFQFNVDGPAWPSQQPEENRTMAGTTSIGIEIGGVRYDGLDPSLAQAVAGVLQRAEKAEGDLGAARTDAITHKAACDAIKKQMSDTKAAYDAQMAEMTKQLSGLQAKMAENEEKKVQGEAEGTIAGAGEVERGDSFLKRFDARVKLLGTAKRVGVEKADAMTDEALRLAVVKAHNPDLRMDEADKSYPVAYVAALEAQLARADASQGTAAAAAAGVKPGEAPKPPAVRADEDLKAARNEYMKSTYGC